MEIPKLEKKYCIKCNEEIQKERNIIVMENSEKNIQHTNQTESLKFCPFCGGEARMFEHKKRHDESKIDRVEIWCVSHCISRHKKTLDEAIQAWNTRSEVEKEELDNFKIANIVRIYSGWDIDEESCFRIADKICADFKAPKNVELPSVEETRKAIDYVVPHFYVESAVEAIHTLLKDKLKGADDEQDN